MSDTHDTRLIIDYGKRTHPGGRDENQDCLNAFLDNEGDLYCFVIADGLGGYKGGSSASHLAVESILNSLSGIDKENPGTWLYDALQEAHRLIKERRETDSSVRSMKTTCVVIVVISGKAYWASVGDSRIYIIRNNAILHRSKDHSVVQILLDMGEIKPQDVRSHPDRNRVLRVLGMDDDMKPTISSDGLVLERGDCILLCTDGFWEYVDDSGIVDFINTHASIRAQSLIDALFAKIITTARKCMANKRHDNLSAQLIMIK
jgi:PPM family protein phosphatase